MARGIPITSTIINPNGASPWERFAFPTLDPSMNGIGERWFAARNTANKPYCFTPTKPFWFGGKKYVGLYPCIAFATRDFSFIAQRGPRGMVLGIE